MSLAILIPLSKITATDISESALKIAIKNAMLNNVVNQIEFIKSNWCSNLKDAKFEYIVSNPPYIDSADKPYMSQETLLYEPENACFADNNGLIFYDKIISEATYFLKKGGKILLEIGFNQSKSVVSVLEKHQFTEIVIIKDLSSHDRVIRATFE